MNKSIRKDLVYGETELEAIHKKANDIAWKLFEEKKKGSEKLQTRYREHLKKTIDIERSEYKLSNEEKKVASERAFNEAVDVSCCSNYVI